MENNYIKSNGYIDPEILKNDDSKNLPYLDDIFNKYHCDKSQYSQYDSIINVIDYTSAALKTKGMEEVLDEENLLTLKEQVKLLEKKIREKNKPKTITISGETHNKIKNFCNSININIGDWVSKTVIDAIDDYINKYDCILNSEEEIDDKKVLQEKYSDLIINEEGIAIYTKEAYNAIHNQDVFKSLNVQFEEEDDIVVDKLIPKDVILEDVQINTTDGFPGFDFDKYQIATNLEYLSDDKEND